MSIKSLKNAINYGENALIKAHNDTDGLNKEYEEEHLNYSKLALESLKKQLPLVIKEDVKIINGYESVYFLCPVCNWNVSSGDKYCKHCGQAIKLN